ncbi:nonsense-mediated mRNA decay factor SMG8-like [Hippocampus zosterae]|uniref:nonsense-mediated mRNA decay factor SMG8-like n=1 Tax=Hippocampus zosterae TaxID=109293 RepID=UPI00223CFD69|nr:nonsense-mediated mRNA decay factor SMG8-like [Hippocampus zosterae]
MKAGNTAAAVSLEALLRAGVSEDADHRDDGVCVVGIFGKSNMQLGALKESLVNILADKHVFSAFGGADDGGSGCGGIQALYNPDNRVLYLLLTSVCDGRQLLLRACRSASAGGGHAEAHDFWKGLERQHCLGLLYLFSVCHVLLLVHPNHTFDVTYDRLFRALDALRQKALPLLRAAVKDCPVSKEWKVNCRPCPPRLLFVFQMSGTLKVPNGSEASIHPDKPKKHSPRRRLQHALEDQIYRIFRKSRVLTNQSGNCLFTVPANQAFVYVLPASDEDPAGALLSQLRSNCILCEQDSGALVSGPRRYQQTRRSARQGAAEQSGAAGGAAPADCSLKEFLWQHVELVLTKKGFDDSVGRNPQPCHFELPSYSKWAQVALKLHRALAGGDDDDGDDAAELAAKVQVQLKVLDGFLDADAKFSENRCQKALPVAHSAYQANLPHNYTTAVHKNQLAQALRVYSQHARGVAFQRYALQLHEDCYKFWSNGHQLCEERSLSDQHCVHKFHLLPQPGEPTDMDHNPPILNHNSRGRSTGSCNCGRKQAPREDPFDVQAANFEFYQALEEKCCGKLERIDFPIFQPSTPDPAPASNRAQRPPCEADADRLKEPGAAHSHTPGDTSLSLALSLGQSTDSSGPYADSASAAGAPPDGQVQQKRPSLADRQPSTVEYLPGMMHSGCPKGLLPKFSSWSLVKLGPAKSYNCHKGLEQPGFLPGASFLLPWDLVIRSRCEDDPAEPLDGGASSWPAPNKMPAGKRGGAGGPGRGRRRDDTARAYVGFEYEDGRGRRFIGSGPDKIVKALGPAGAKEPAGRVLNGDMPLYVPSPSQGRGVKPHFAQLMRLFVVVPDAPLEVTLNPQVQPGPPPCPVFHPEQTDVVLPADGLWVLRFPYAYATEMGPCYPPKENQPLAHYKVLRGILRAAANAQPQEALR